MFFVRAATKVTSTCQSLSVDKKFPPEIQKLSEDQELQGLRKNIIIKLTKR